MSTPPPHLTVSVPASSPGEDAAPRASVTDEVLRRVLEDAELPALLPALAHALGDVSLLGEELRPPRAEMGVPQGGLSAAQQQRAREVAFDALRRYRDGEGADQQDLSLHALRTMMTFVTGDVDDDYLPLLAHELGLDDALAAVQQDPIAEPLVPEDFSVIVIGAGMNGIAIAHELSKAGVPFQVFEKNDDVGGVWLLNTYPGCRLDTSNYAYSYSYNQKHDWPDEYSTQPTILQYFREAVEAEGLRERIQFGAHVVEATYRDDHRWSVRVRRGDGSETNHVANVVVSSVGQLNNPKLPDVPGIDLFRGPSWHTGTWNHDVSLAGKRVAVVGTGASAYQVVPAIAGEVGELFVFQRNAPWMLPTPRYHAEHAEGLLWLFEYLPTYHRWYRFYQFWTSVEGRRPYAVIDPEWTGEGAVSEINAEIRAQLEEHLLQQFPPGSPLRDKVVPTYPPFAKRMLRDNGVWAEALLRDNVELIDAPIAEVVESGIRTADGRVVEVDIIVYATGFRASDFLSSLRVTGRGGLSLHDYWDGDARAYLGVAVPHFPNLFCLYGPNSNLVLNGSLILFAECATNLIMSCITTLLATDRAALEIREDVFASFNEAVDAQNALMAWGAPGVTSWYKNAKGRVSQNWPFPILDYWQMTRKADPELFTFHGTLSDELAATHNGSEVAK